LRHCGREVWLAAPHQTIRQAHWIFSLPHLLRKSNSTQHAELKNRSYVGEGELISILRWFAVGCRMVAAIAGPLNLPSLDMALKVLSSPSSPPPLLPPPKKPKIRALVDEHLPHKSFPHHNAAIQWSCPSERAFLAQSYRSLYVSRISLFT
jgi:hypothetical protein